jgi:hypothetical protein
MHTVAKQLESFCCSPQAACDQTLQTNPRATAPTGAPRDVQTSWGDAECVTAQRRPWPPDEVSAPLVMQIAFLSHEAPMLSSDHTNGQLRLRECCKDTHHFNEVRSTCRLPLAGRVWGGARARGTESADVYFQQTPANCARPHKTSCDTTNGRAHTTMKATSEWPRVSHTHT